MVEIIRYEKSEEKRRLKILLYQLNNKKFFGFSIRIKGWDGHWQLRVELKKRFKKIIYEFHKEKIDIFKPKGVYIFETYVSKVTKELIALSKIIENQTGMEVRIIQAYPYDLVYGTNPKIKNIFSGLFSFNSDSFILSVIFPSLIIVFLFFILFVVLLGVL